MLKIKEYDFPIDNLVIKQEKYGQNWPVVYLLHNQSKIYIGETNNMLSRMNQHQTTPEKLIFSNVHMITDSDFNKSATLDIESTLIKYISADEKFIVTNKNDGIVNSNYYQRQTYQERITKIWEQLKKQNMVQKDLIQIENSDIFKFSPYKSLSEDQFTVVETIVQDIIYRNINNERGIYFVNGLPGSGKTVLATYLAKYITQTEELEGKNLALVISMSSLRGTLKKAFKYVNGLSMKMVIGPSDLHEEQYDILLIDEAHRLRRRYAITNYQSFDKKNAEFGLDEKGNELDWILRSSKHIILFYDENQSVRPSDIDKSIFCNLKPNYSFTLNSQFRVKAGMEFINYIRNIFHCSQVEPLTFENYDVKIIEKFSDFVDLIRHKNDEFGLSLIVSGYAFEWKSKNDSSKFDIEIDDIKMKWNSINIDFIHSPNAINEVGCIHTVQGYELNYVGIIIGKEIDYNPQTNELIVFPSRYHDRNGKSGTNIDELLIYIKNIYIVLSTRGIHGVYFYVMNDHMRTYLSRYFETLSGS